VFGNRGAEERLVAAPVPIGPIAHPTASQ
jgi:hypothetical protein